jgi:hypothetical protein
MRDRRRATRRDISAQIQGPLVRAFCFLHAVVPLCIASRVLFFHAPFDRFTY